MILLIIAVTMNFILAFFVYRDNSKSATNILFGLLGCVMSLWLIANYVSLIPQSSTDENLSWIRLSIFLAMPMTALFFLLAHTIPNNYLMLKQKWVIALAVVTFGTMLINISPFAFTDVAVVNGGISPLPGPGIIPFALFSSLLSIFAIWIIFQKFRKSAGIERNRLRFILGGIVSMLCLIILSVFIPVVLFRVSLFVTLIPLYALVFLGATAYAIVRHELFNVKIIATEGVSIILCVVLFSKIFVAKSGVEITIDSFILLLSVIFTVLLVKSVSREVKERERLDALTKELASVNERLIKLDRLRSEFLSFASHQVKSPMAVVKGYAELILEGSYGNVPPLVAGVITKIKDSVDRLISLVNNLLDLRRLEEGKMDYVMEDVDIALLARDVGSEFSTLAESKGLKFSTDISKDELMISADSQKLRQVIQNFIDNAIKYTEKGEVKLAVERKNRNGRMSAIISVTDSGMGMKPELIANLFTQFTRDPSVKNLIQGTGLGLYIARQIVIAHKGEVWAESAGEGKGSTFFVSIPLVSGQRSE